MVSFDSTMRSNISVGLPIDLASIKKDTLRFELQHHITEDDPYFSQISKRWCDGLRNVFDALPDPEWQFADKPQTGCHW